MLIQSLFTLLCIVLLIYYTCDVNICVEIDPGTHMLCARFYPLEPGVTVNDNGTLKRSKRKMGRREKVWEVL
jgi:hypothetical protein